MKYDGELNELLLNVQRNMKNRHSGITERQVNNATVDKKHYQRMSENERKQQQIISAIKSCTKDTLGLDTKRSC